MSKTKIEWADTVWNPVTGCTKVSPGCEHCYAERMAKRLAGRCGYDKDDPFRVTIHMDRMKEPIGWRKPRRVFVCSMGDLFHKDVSDATILDVLSVMRVTSSNQYMILTKRAARLRTFAAAWDIHIANNVWLGVSVETVDQQDRITDLRNTFCPNRFISFEPLLAPVGKLSLSGIDWVIVGGESGPGARPIKPEWVRDIRDACIEQNVPFFFKQWGGTNKKQTGRILDGRTWDEVPESMRKEQP